MDAKFSPENQNQNRELNVVAHETSASTSFYPQFKIPDDWVVERRCRSKHSSHRAHIDKYYEPGTGLRLRSPKSAQKYPSGETSNSVNPRNKKNMQIVPYVFKSRSLFNLPDGWMVEKKPRKNINCTGIINKSSKCSVCRKEPVHCKKVENSMPGSSSTPTKVKWLLGGPAGNVWIPFMDDSLVPESIKQKWAEAFVFSLNGRF